MKTIELKANLRKEVGKKQTKSLRTKGLVPCVMYGGEKIVHFTVPEIDLRHIIYTPDVFLVKIDVDGSKYLAILQDSQFHPVTDKILHLDFIQVFEDKATVVSLPVSVTGKSEGIIAGGKLRQRRRYLKVRGLINDLPETLAVDITNLKIGDFVKVEDLVYPNLELLDPARAMVLGISASRISKGMEEGEAGVEAEVAEAEAAAGGGEEASEEKAE
jgi:large subunit ribosomal protein L25